MSSAQPNQTETNLRLQAVIETAIDGIITIDVKGNIDSINQAARNLFGYSSEELIGHNVKILMPEPYHTEHDGYLQRYQDTHEPKIIGIGREVQGRKKDGTVFPIRLAVSEVDLGEKVIYTGIVHDLTDVKAAESRLEELNVSLERIVAERTDELANTVDKLSQSNDRLAHEVDERLEAESRLREALQKEKELGQLKSRFVSLVSHEFRTPLTTVMSSADLIAAYDQTDQQDKRQKHVNRIRQSVEALTNILNDLLSISSLEEGGVRSNFETFSLSELIQELKDQLQALLKPNQQLTFEQNGFDLVFNDKDILRRILTNLLSNGIKYSPSGTEVSCRVTHEDDILQIEVKDHGIGIPSVDQDHLFTRFFRAGNVENIQGTGLGLNLVKRYLELLNGEIGFESIEGKGSTFYCSIPIPPTTKPIK
ncbi:MAG: PAS domain-containing sensor histidine kinase [Bacteroidota bacterium]